MRGGGGGVNKYCGASSAAKSEWESAKGRGGEGRARQDEGWKLKLARITVIGFGLFCLPGICFSFLVFRCCSCFVSTRRFSCLENDYRLGRAFAFGGARCWVEFGLLRVPSRGKYTNCREREYLSVCARGLPNKFQQTGVVMLENWVKIGGIVGGGEGGIEGNKMDLGIVFFLFGTKLALQTVLIQWILCWRLWILFLEWSFLYFKVGNYHLLKISLAQRK